MLKAIVPILCVAVALGYPSYPSLIPNGFSVPNPCGGGIWRGVGHLAQIGSGPLNPFGMAFRDNDHRWNKTLCMLDSDGDGMTNGEELGDSGCHWTEDRPTNLPAARGHPGICEPVGSAKCAGSGFMC
ncbi:hypothetical protein EGW08_007096 [Elysia chlorotica]|uniref:Temptin Cys/Cys disulfide domain-containing protein n=1 Tax=Elysia chlorotica TaxID=188477 RepID=A0A433TU88_ELYCH|nr:hypothetical protein EGW08_007096 [Elysia chlorotica]